jgi:hypothetical protein
MRMLMKRIYRCIVGCIIWNNVGSECNRDMDASGYWESVADWEFGALL